MSFSLRRLLAFTAAVAATCCSLVYCTPLLGDAYYTLCIAAIGLGLIAAVARQGEKRFFWLGFSFVAAAYGWLTIFGEQYGQTSNFYHHVQYGEIAGYNAALISSRLLTIAYSSIAAEGGGPRLQHVSEFERFMPYITIGHASLSILCGWMGGVAARSFYRGRVRQSPAPSR